ncbi:hypothetical protein, partial [Crossiella equi]|uniref:hypothetical protein n=1 Tax=Crossiella equi TaxID=130796 RepID=UPI000A37907A
VGVVDRELGVLLDVGHVDADRQFRSASLVKLLIAVDAMQSGLADDSRIGKMLALSHDQIASELWMATGGNAMVARQARRMGLSRTVPPLDPLHWGDTKVTAREMAKVYRFVLTKLPARQRDVIMKALATAPAVAADGYNQHFGIPNGLPEVSWAIKQGWASGRAGTDLHTSGVVEGTIVVILTTHTSGTGYPRGMRAVTEGAAVLAELFA